MATGNISAVQPGVPLLFQFAHLSEHWGHNIRCRCGDCEIIKSMRLNPMIDTPIMEQIHKIVDDLARAKHPQFFDEDAPSRVEILTASIVWKSEHRTSQDLTRLSNQDAITQIEMMFLRQGIDRIVVRYEIKDIVVE